MIAIFFFDMTEEHWRSLRGRPAQVQFQSTARTFDLFFPGTDQEEAYRVQACSDTKTTAEFLYQRNVGHYLIDFWDEGAEVISVRTPALRNGNVLKTANRGLIVEVGWKDQQFLFTGKVHTAHHLAWDLRTPDGLSKYPEYLYRFIREHPRHWWAIQHMNPYDNRIVTLFTSHPPRPERMNDIWEVANELEQELRDGQDRRPLASG